MNLKCGAQVVITRNIAVTGGVINGIIENIQSNLITDVLETMNLCALPVLNTILAYLIAQMWPLENSSL